MKIAARIRSDIVAGELRFGSRLTIDQLALRYATSHMPVREALRELVGEGLIVSEPNRGTHVRDVDEAFVSGLMDLRATIEAHLAERAAERATEAHIRELQEIEQRLERCVASKSYAAALEANFAFHNRINAIASSPDGAAVVDRHWLLLAALWRQYGYAEDRFADVISDHRHLITAFEERDGTAAKLIMGAHAAKSKQLLIRQMRSRKRATEKDTPIEPSQPAAHQGRG